MISGNFFSKTQLFARTERNSRIPIKNQLSDFEDRSTIVDTVFRISELVIVVNLISKHPESVSVIVCSFIMLIIAMIRWRLNTDADIAAKPFVLMLPKLAFFRVKIMMRTEVKLFIRAEDLAS